jgi:tRNA 5-methylaminomethyl-2-thiouridine biosynthesis bifunctional protein
LANAQNASSLLALLGTHIPPTQTIRGQLSTLRLPDSHTLRLPVIGEGHVAQLLHPTHTELLIGASYDRDNLNKHPDLQSRQGNLERLTKLLPNFGDALIRCSMDLNPDTLLNEQVAFRCASRDRLPLLGAIFQEKAWQPTEAGIHLNNLPRFPGLYGAWAYGSRGLIWASLGAEYLAAQLEGEPLPIERSILAGLDPARFFLRQFRHSSSIQSASK